MMRYNNSYEEYVLNIDFAEENLENELFCKNYENIEDWKI